MYDLRLTRPGSRTRPPELGRRRVTHSSAGAWAKADHALVRRSLGEGGSRITSAVARSRSPASVLAFTLIEILVTIGLLSFIVLGLLAMFNQTQRAFRAGMAQTDILESGRASMDIIARELEQTTPSEYPYLNNGLGYPVIWSQYPVSSIPYNIVRFAATNFFVEFAPGFNNPPLLQELPGNVLPRTNLVQRFFFLTQVNQDWVGIGYQVIPDDTNGCVGTLYRFVGTNFSRQGPMTVSGDFRSAAALAFQNAVQQGVQVTNLNRIADGVVHLRVRTFATNGFPIVVNPFGPVGTNGLFVLTNNPLAMRYSSVWDTSVYGGPFDREQAASYFMKEAVPAFVEVELGILEPQVLRRYRSIPIGAVQRQYLSNHVAEVHIFRQRVPIRNLDFTAYP